MIGVLLISINSMINGELAEIGPPSISRQEALQRLVNRFPGLVLTNIASKDDGLHRKLTMLPNKSYENSLFRRRRR